MWRHTPKGGGLGWRPYISCERYKEELGKEQARLLAEWDIAGKLRAELECIGCPKQEIMQYCQATSAMLVPPLSNMGDQDPGTPTLVLS